MKLNIIFNKYYFVCVKNCMQHCYFLFALQSKLYNIIYKNCHECLSYFVKNHSLLVVTWVLRCVMNLLHSKVQDQNLLFTSINTKVSYTCCVSLIHTHYFIYSQPIIPAINSWDLPTSWNTMQTLFQYEVADKSLTNIPEFTKIHSVKRKLTHYV